MGLIRMTKRTGREKPCDSQVIFMTDDREEPNHAPRQGITVRRAKAVMQDNKWSHDLWQGAPGRASWTPSRLRSQQAPPARRGAPLKTQSSLPDDKMRGWSDEPAPTPVTKVKMPFSQRSLRDMPPKRLVGVRKAIEKPKAFTRSLASQRVDARRTISAHMDDGELDDSAYSASGLFGRQGGKGYSKGKGFSKGTRGYGKGGGKKGRGKGKGKKRSW
mmetsp:Transcript_93841/g.148239  ORF Transcript_93841/g.148239 Transcript_93841/m.148239 type:complete len:217 (+) Transcript_93841:107-757(+)